MYSIPDVTLQVPMNRKTAELSGFFLSSPQDVSYLRRYPYWSALVDDVRTWIQDTTEYFKLPDLTIPAQAETL